MLELYCFCQFGELKKEVENNDDQASRYNTDIFCPKCSGNLHDAKILREDTVEISKNLVNLQMRNAGYRLAYLLNQYFGK